MTSIEKAKELIKLFLEDIPLCDGTGSHKDDIRQQYNTAKYCAITNIDEILKEYSSQRIKPWLSLNNANELAKFWEEVKRHLEQL